MSNPLNGILGPTAGGAGGSGDVTGPASSTDNAVARFDGATGKLLQDSALTVSDVAGGVVTLATTAGNALAVLNTAPAAAAGASVAGDPLTVTAGAAVASTDTNGAAAGGSVTITGGAAARRNSGNANGGDVLLVGGAGIGTGTAGQIVIPDGVEATKAGIRLNSGAAGTGWIYKDGGWAFINASGTRAYLGSSLGLGSASQLYWNSGNAGATGNDTGLARIAAGQLSVSNATNGMANNVKIATTTVNASGATSTATNLVPAGCILLGVTTRVTTAITSGDGGTSVNIGNGTDADMYGAAIAFTLGTTTNLASHTASALAFVSAAQNVVFTCVGGTFNGGVWRVCAHYLDLTAPTS